MNKLIGEIDNDKSVYTTFRSRTHIFRKFNGFGLSSQVIDHLYNLGIKFVIINFENKRAYWTDLDKFSIRGIYFTDTSNGKPDEQVILDIKYFKTEEDIGKVEESQDKLTT